MYPTPEQRMTIVSRSGLEIAEPSQRVMVNGGRLSLRFRLPAHGVSLVTVTRGE
jgi:hypothetical protein